MVGISRRGGAPAATVNTCLHQARQERASTQITGDVAPSGGEDPLVPGGIEIPRIGVTAFVPEGTTMLGYGVAFARTANGITPSKARVRELEP